MSHQLINPPDLPTPRGFNHGVLATGGRLLFLAGQDASGPDGQVVGVGDLVAQMERVLRNIQAVVTAAGGTMQDVVQLTVFVRDRKDYLAHLKPLGDVFRAHFGGYYPAMALFEVSGFFQDEALIEMQGITVMTSLLGSSPRRGEEARRSSSDSGGAGGVVRRPHSGRGGAGGEVLPSPRRRGSRGEVSKGGGQ